MREEIKRLISKHSTVILTLLIIVGGILRFYDLNWGSPFYFHPDERNVASSISQILVNSLNPNFFAYGSLPIYAVFFIGAISNFFTKCGLSFTECVVPFEQAIIISRIFSAILGTLLIPLVYLLGKNLGGKFTGLLAAFFTTFSVGLIQFSHFGTFEIWTTTFATLQLYAAVLYLKKQSKKYFYTMVVLTGILTAIKISNIILLLIPIFCIFVNLVSNQKYKKWKHVFGAFALLLLLLVYSLAIFLAANPFIVLDSKSFLGSMNYESSVAIGSMPVFYTGEFFGSIPVLFQATKVYPFLINPLMLPFAIISIAWITYLAFSRRRIDLLLLLLSFSVLFFSQALLFVKWTRYMLPTLPFIYLMIGIFFKDSLSSTKHKFSNALISIVLIVLLLTSFLFSFSYVKTVFVSQDTRILAKEFALKTIPAESRILSEVYDLGITPFNDRFKKITLFNFYDLDSDPDTTPSLDEILEETDYLILPSQRIFATRTGNPGKFPLGSKFYESFLKDSSRYTLIYKTPCDVFCKITYLGDPVKRFEGTANVFDRPHVMIFKVDEK